MKRVIKQRLLELSGIRYKSLLVAIGLSYPGQAREPRLHEQILNLARNNSDHPNFTYHPNNI